MKCENCVRGILMVVLCFNGFYCLGMMTVSPDVGAAYFIVALASLIVGVTQYVKGVYLDPGRTTSLFENR